MAELPIPLLSLSHLSRPLVCNVFGCAYCALSPDALTSFSHSLTHLPPYSATPSLVLSATIGLPTYLLYCAAGLGERLGTGIVNLSILVIRSKNNSDLVFQKKKIPFTFSVRMG
jgi:hypothetical protein